MIQRTDSITTNDPVCPVCWESYHANDPTGAVCINRLQTKVRKLESEVTLLKLEKKSLLEAMDFTLGCLERSVKTTPEQLDEWIREMRRWRGPRKEKEDVEGMAGS